MPRLHGINPLAAELAGPEQLAVAQALGHNLAELHALTWPFAGDYDLASDTIQPFAGGFAGWLITDIRSWLDQARSHGTATTAADVAWIERVIGEAEPALAVDFQPYFVMNDYNPGNLLVAQVPGSWQVTGLFDLMEYYFGHGEAGLMRAIAIYLDTYPHHGAQLAQTLGTAYLDRSPAGRGFSERFTFHRLRDGLIVWEYGTRPGHNWFPEGQTFRDYAARYTETFRLFAPAIS